MPTAIIRTYTSEGFVIAADGLRVNVEDWSVWSDNVQKIFPVEGIGGSLAYSAMGTIELRDFFLLTEAEKAVHAIPVAMAKDLPEYVSLLGRRIAVRLSELNGDYPTIDNGDINDRGFRIATLFFDGYFKTAPSRAYVSFYHERQKLLEPKVTSEDLNFQFGCPQFRGSSQLFHLLFRSDDPRFAAYRRPALRPQDVTLREAAEISTNYIQACESPEGRKADPDICPSIGGHIHIATITPTGGFQWVREPLP